MESVVESVAHPGTHLCGLKAGRSVTLLELDEADASSWTWLPVLRQRMAVASQTICPDTPADALWQHVLRLWVNPETKHLVRLWLAVDEQRAPIAHAVGFVEVYWGKPVLLIHQMLADEGQMVSALFEEFLSALQNWHARLSQPLSSPLPIWFFTERAPGVWQRYVRSRGNGAFEVLPVRTMIRLMPKGA